MASKFRSFERSGSVAVLAAIGIATLAAPAHAQNVSSLACSPTTVAGGSGATVNCTVVLNAAAPAGGAAVTLSSSLTALAASVPSITVPAGQTTATFAVGTNARYRRYSGLPFTATISATRTTTATAQIAVTAQPLPPPFNSGSTAGANTQWSGAMCGGIAPIGGDLGILYTCSPAPSNQPGFGSCSFRQECPIGCRRVPPSGGTFNDFCATTGPNPIAIDTGYIVSGDRVPATIRAEGPVTRSTAGVPSTISPHATPFSRANVGGIPFPSGAASVPFEVATSYVPTPEFVDVGAFWFDDAIPPLLITSGRAGQAWLAMAPPDPPPAVALPTLVDFRFDGTNPSIPGGQRALGLVTVSGFSTDAGPTVFMSSNQPAGAPPASVVVNASHVSGNQVMTSTVAPAAATAVTLTVTDGRYTATDVMTVQPNSAGPPGPQWGLSFDPSSVLGGTTTTGTVSLQFVVQPGASVPVTLTSSNPAVAAVPASVTVPAGASSATFTVTTGSVATSTSVTITASCCNITIPGSLMVTTAVPPPAPPVAVTLSPVNVEGGAGSAATVTLAAAAPAGGAVVRLSSNNAAARVPPTVTVPAGATTATFAVATSAVAALAPVTITAARNDDVFNAVLAVNPPAAGAAKLAGIILNPATVPAGSTAQATVTLSAPAPAGGAVVSLASQFGQANVPSSVAIPAGASTATFTVATNVPSQPGTIPIEARYGGVSRLAQLMTILPVDPDAVLESFTLAQSSVTGGFIVDATVTLSGPAPSSGAGGAEIETTSSNPGVARISGDVIVGTGRTSADFSIITSTVTAPTPVTLTASFGGVTRTQVLTVNPAGGGGPTLASIAVSPTSVVGGSPATGTVTLSGAAPSGGRVVTLSDNSSAASVPSSVTVPSGATSATFTVGTNTVSAATTVTITGTAGGTTRTTTLTVNAGGLTAPSLVSPANDARPAQPVTFDWSDVGGAASYEIQIDTSSTISAPFTASQVVTESRVTIGGLPARRLWWRVRARNAAGATGPFSSTRRFTPQSAPAAPALSTLSLSPASVVGGSGSTGTVTLTAAAPSGGAVVTLSDNSAAASVPASVTVAAGASSATFAIATTAVTAATPVAITGVFGGASRTATLTVNPAGAAASLASVSVNPAAVTGGASSTGTVTLTSPAPSGGAVVTLSDNSAAASAPASVTVAAGASSATFAIATTAVTATTPVTITGVFGGATRTATLTVNPAGQAVTLTVTATGRSGERVTSTPAGINVAVGSTGSASFASGTAITLRVTDDRDAVWSGACSSGGDKTETCTFTITGNASVSANVQ